MEDAILECGRADQGVVSRQQTGRLAQQASLALDHKRRWKGAAPRSETLQGRTARWTTPQVLAAVP